jgi:MFS family permease
MPTATWRTPTLIVAAGCLLTIVAFGTRSSFGLFLEPMTAFHGWTREEFAFALAIQNLLWGAAQPFAGALADRYGADRVLAAGLVTYALGTALMALAPSPGLLTLSAGVVIGLAQAFAAFSIVLAAFARLLPEERRSWAFGVGTAAGSLGQFLMVPLGQAFIGAFGWFEALLLLAACLLLVVPLATLLRTPSPDAAQVTTVPLPLRRVLAHAIGHRSYGLLVAGFFVCGFHVAFIAVHLPAFLTDQGMAPGLGAAAIALIGLFNVVGAYTAGVLGGRRSKKNLLCWIYLLRAVVILAFVTLPITPLTVYLFAAAMGLLWLSTVPPTSGLVAAMFGVRNMAMLFGVVFFSHQVGAFIGVWLGGWLFDHTGSYDLVWWISIALGLFAALVHWPIREGAAPPLVPAPAR